MKIDMTTIKEQKIRIYSLSGEFNFNRLFQALVDVYHYKDFDPSLNSIWDFSKVDNIQKIAFDQLEKIVARVVRQRSKFGKIKTAIVVSSDIDQGLAKMFEQGVRIASQTEISVFRDMYHAILWMK